MATDALIERLDLERLKKAQIRDERDRQERFLEDGAALAARVRLR
jgi:hypothetical protein